MSIKLPAILTKNPIIAQTFYQQRLTRKRIIARIFGTILISHGPTLMMMGVVAIFSPRTIMDDLKEISYATFNITTFCLLVAMTLLPPRNAIAAISQERERKTLSILLITLLSARSIVVGKWIAALFYPLFIIISIVPLFLTCWFIGGVSLQAIAISLILLFTTTIAFTAIGLFGSSLAQTTTNAALITYGAILPLLLIAPFLGMGMIIIGENLLQTSYQQTSLINSYGWILASSLNPIVAAVYSTHLQAEYGSWLFFQRMIVQENYYLISPWVLYIIFYSLITWFLIQLTIRRIKNFSHQ